MIEDDMDDLPLVSYEWTPEEAYAVVTFLEGLAEAVWCRHGLSIRAWLYSPGCHLDDPQQLDLPFHPSWLCGDDLPF